MDTQNNQQTFKKVYKTPLSDIVLFSLTSVYFLSLFIIIFLLFIHHINLLFLLLVSLTIISTFITYMLYRTHIISLDEQTISIKKGIFNPSYDTIQHQSLEGIVIKTSILRYLINIVRVEVIYKKDLLDNSYLAKAVLFPFIKKQRLEKLLKEFIPIYHERKNLHSLPKHAFFVHLVQPSYTLIIVTFFIFFFWPEYWGIPFALFIFFILHRILKVQSTKVHLQRDWLQVQTGVFSKSFLMIKRQPIETVSINQSWLQQKLGLATVTMSTLATPAHISIVKHIPIQTAQEFVKEYHENTST